MASLAKLCEFLNITRNIVFSTCICSYNEYYILMQMCNLKLSVFFMPIYKGIRNISIKNKCLSATRTVLKKCVLRTFLSFIWVDVF